MVQRIIPDSLMLCNQTCPLPECENPQCNASMLYIDRRSFLKRKYFMTGLLPGILESDTNFSMRAKEELGVDVVVRCDELVVCVVCNELTEFVYYY